MKNLKKCDHHFVYSHSETNPTSSYTPYAPLIPLQSAGIGTAGIGTGGMFYKRVDVVVCTKCGEVIRK